MCSNVESYFHKLPEQDLSASCGIFLANKACLKSFLIHVGILLIAKEKERLSATVIVLTEIVLTAYYSFWLLLPLKKDSCQEVLV